MKFTEIESRYYSGFRRYILIGFDPTIYIASACDDDTSFSSPQIISANVRVLLQVGDFIMSSPELQLGFILLMKLRTFAGLIRRARATAESST